MPPSARSNTYITPPRSRRTASRRGSFAGTKSENALMGVEYVDLVAGMPSHFDMPQEFLELSVWSSRQGFAREGYGYLADPAKGAHCLVRLGERSDVRDWSGYLRDPGRLWHVASTGGEGSSVCLWLDDAG